MSRGTISIAGVGKEFGAATVLDAVDLTIAGGSFVTLLGPSGCGKTTLLRLIAGFLEPSRGTIAIDGVPMQGVPPRLRPLGMVFQNLALFPHLDVFENVAYGMRIRGMAAAEISGRVSRFLTLVGLAGFERRRIGQLSGGQKQRVALARSLALEPAILLLDEPLSALDLQLRRQLQVELKSIQRQLATTFVFVTHDQEEATMLSDTIVVMNGGHVQQVGTPGEIYRRPARPSSRASWATSTCWTAASRRSTPGRLPCPSPAGASRCRAPRSSGTPRPAAPASSPAGPNRSASARHRPTRCRSRPVYRRCIASGPP